MNCPVCGEEMEKKRSSTFDKNGLPDSEIRRLPKEGENFVFFECWACEMRKNRLGYYFLIIGTRAYLFHGAKWYPIEETFILG